MPNQPAGPVCPKCRRRLAAWRLDHCVYCGERFPEGIREGFTEPEALKYVDRPGIPPAAAKQLEMMKHIEIRTDRKPKTVGRALTVLILPVFVAIFYLMYRLAERAFPSAAILIVGAGLLLLGYVAWSVARSSR